MGDDTVLQFGFQNGGKSLYRGCPVMNHLRSDHDMAKHLSLIRIFICRKERQLRRFSYVVQDRRRDQQIPVHCGVMLCDVAAQSRHG